jgi:tetratricopeptide (TPR) repeat protein
MLPRVARVLRLGLTLSLVWLPAAAHAAGASDLVAQGDAAWARRADGHDGQGRAAPEPIADAIRAYEAAVAAAPDALEPRWKLLRAFHFAADFASRDGDEEHAFVERATAAADDAEELLARGDATARDAAALHFWSAVAWAAWGQRHGLLGAVRKGVADRVHDDALAALELDPAVEDGGAHRMLARLHATLPRVPFLSGWVDRDRAVPEMERALALAPDHLGNRVLWALTLLDVAPARRAEALAALEAASAAEPSGEATVEDLAIRKTARERLAEERGRDRG